MPEESLIQIVANSGIVGLMFIMWAMEIKTRRKRDRQIDEALQSASNYQLQFETMIKALNDSTAAIAKVVTLLEIENTRMAAQSFVAKNP